MHARAAEALQKLATGKLVAAGLTDADAPGFAPQHALAGLVLAPDFPGLPTYAAIGLFPGEAPVG